LDDSDLEIERDDANDAGDEAEAIAAPSRTRGRGADRERKRGRKGRGKKERKKGKRGLIAFLLASAVPVAAAVFWLAQTEERREEILDKIPDRDGAGGRAVAAAITFGILILLARVALPAFHGASGALGGLLARMREKPKAIRVLLFPVEFVVYLGWLFLQMLFAVDAFLIIACALIGLLLVIRIVQPDFLSGVLPEFAG
jgi:hypothetical protein